MILTAQSQASCMLLRVDDVFRGVRRGHDTEAAIMQ